MKTTTADGMKKRIGGLDWDSFFRVLYGCAICRIVKKNNVFCVWKFKDGSELTCLADGSCLSGEIEK